MNPILTRLLVLALSISSGMPSARAAWSPAEGAWLHEFQRHALDFTDGNLATTWGGVQRTVRAKGSKTPRASTVSLPQWLARPLPWILHRSARQKRAPLRVFLTGLFGDLSDATATRHTQLLVQTGSHVLTLPNPWSRDFILARPHALPGTIPAEAATVRAAIQSALEQLGPESITTIDLIGVSYGAFLATATFTLDQKSSEPLITGRLVALSPPGELLSATSSFDSGFTSLDPSSRCREVSQASLLLDYAFARTERDLRTLSRECADFLLFGSFHDGLVALAESLHETRGLGAIPDREHEKPAFETWKQSLTLTHVIDEYLLQGKPPTEEQLEESHLSHWWRAIPSESLTRVRMLTSTDDFVNSTFDWGYELARYPLPEATLITLPWGGHYGFGGHREFEAFFKQLFEAQPGLESLSH